MTPKQPSTNTHPLVLLNMAKALCMCQMEVSAWPKQTEGLQEPVESFSLLHDHVGIESTLHHDANGGISAQFHRPLRPAQRAFCHQSSKLGPQAEQFRSFQGLSQTQAAQLSPEHRGA